MEVVLLRRPHADRVVTQVVGKHGDGAFQIDLRVSPESRETRELVEHERLPAILLRPLELLGRQEGGSDLGRGLRERVDLYLAIALLLGAVLHADHAERPTIGTEWSDHRFTRGGVRSTLYLAREQHRAAGLRHRARDAFTDPLSVELRGIRKPTRASD